MKKYIYLFIVSAGLFFTSCGFNSKNEVQYKVLHMQQNIENNEYTVFEEEDYTAAIGSKIKVQYKDYEGFTVQPVEQQIIKEGLSIPVYYDRNSITFNFNLAGGTGTEKITEKFGTPTKNIVQTPVKGLTRFTGWEPSLPDTFDKDTTFTATWNYPCYKVLYLFENPDDDCYSQNENFPEQIFSGIAGQMTSVQASEITGFTPLEIEQVAIHELAEGEEIPVVTVKYNRNKITLFIDLNDGLGETYVTGKYGQTLNLENIPKPERPKYEFVQYEFIDSSYFSETYTLELNNKKVLRAVWKGEGQARYVIRVFAENIYDDGYSEIGKYLAVGDSDTESNVNFEYTKKADEHRLEIKSDSNVILTYLDSFVPAANKTIQNKKISGDETTRVDVYIDRLKYTYTYAYALPADESQIAFEVTCEPAGFPSYSYPSVKVTGKYGENVTLPNFVREGYSGNETEWIGEEPPAIYSGSNVEQSFSVKWTPNTYTVTFEKNAATATGTVAPMLCKYLDVADTSVKNLEGYPNLLPAYKNMGFRMPGYRVVSWNTKADGSGESFNYQGAWNSPNLQDSVNRVFTNLTSENNGTVTLYAQWEELQTPEIKNLCPYNYANWDARGNNLYMELPACSRLADKYFLDPNNSNIISGLDVETPINIYVNDVLVDTKKLAQKFGGYDCYVSWENSPIGTLQPSRNYTVSAKIAIPKFEGAVNDKDFVTNTTTSVQMHIPGVAQPYNVHVSEYGDGYLILKWKNPLADEIKKLTLKYYKNVAQAKVYTVNIDDLTPGAEVTYKVTNMSDDFKVQFECTDGFNNTGTSGESFIYWRNINSTSAATGQIYYSDNTWSWNYIPEKTPVGIIYETTDGKPSKICALTEFYDQLRTSACNYDFSSVNDTDGSNNWNLLKQVDPSATYDQYPAFKLCNEYKVTELPSLQWYLPSTSDLMKCVYSATSVELSLMLLRENGFDVSGHQSGKYYLSSNGSGKGTFKRMSSSSYNSFSSDVQNFYYVLPVAKLPQ